MIHLRFSINSVNVSTGFKGLKDEQDLKNQSTSKNPFQDSKKETI